MAPEARLALPPLVVSPGDINRLLRELESLEDYMHQAALRHPDGKTPPQPPRVSRMLEELISLNRIDLNLPAQRQLAVRQLQYLQRHAPALHISFASDPSAAFVSRLTNWMRSNIHPHILLNVGLQPAIVAGCVLRTANRQFDMSLRRHFSEQQAGLISDLRGEKVSG